MRVEESILKQYSIIIGSGNFFNSICCIDFAVVLHKAVWRKSTDLGRFLPKRKQEENDSKSEVRIHIAQ